MVRQITLDDVITSLTILRDDCVRSGISMGTFDELIFADTIKIKRGTKSLTIPLVEISGTTRPKTT